MMPEDGGQKKDLFDKAMEIWWGKCVLGIAFAVFAAWLYVELSKLDSGEKESMTVIKFISFLYDIGGKWPPVVVFGLVGVGIFAWGVKQLLSGRE